MKKENYLVRAVKNAAWAMQEPIPDRHNYPPFEAGTSYRRSQKDKFDRAVAQAVEAGVMTPEDGDQTLIDAENAWGEWRGIQKKFFSSDHTAPKRKRSPQQA